jgi:cell division protein FtsB
MTFQPEIEPYREVIDIMAARIKRAEQHNTYLSEGISECQKRIERLNSELENVAWTSSPALAQAQIDQLASTVRGLERENEKLEKDKARLDWLLVNPLEFAPVQIPCPDGRPGCLVYHCRPQTPSEARSTIDAAMDAAMEAKP